MATNENLQQINTFTGGMNSDTSDALLKNDQYRLARNLRLSTETDENEGELHVMQGLKHKWLIQNSTDVIAITSCRQYIITVYNTSSGWCIGVTDTTKNDGNKCIFGPCKDQLGEHLSTKTIFESDKNVKLYIADGLNSLMAINIVKEIESNAVQTNINYLIGYATSQLTSPIVSNLRRENGTLPGGKIQWAYTLYNEGLGETTLSPLSSPTQIYRWDAIVETRTNESGESVTHGNYDVGIPSGEASTSSADITIPIAKSIPLSKIRLYRISYVKDKQDPQIDIVCDTYIDKHINTNIDQQKYPEYSRSKYNFITITDSGDELQQISSTEFKELMNLGIIPKFIESKDNRLFAGNIKYRQDEFDKEIKNYISGITCEYNSVYGDPYTENSYGHILSTDYDKYQRSLMPGEIYRYGIILYSKDGVQSSVHKLFDYEAPSYSEFLKNFDFSNSFPNTPCRPDSARFKLSPLGINIKITLSEELKNKCSGFEIVRCDNNFSNRKILSYGIVGCACGTKDFFYPAHYLTTDELNYHVDRSGGVPTTMYTSGTVQIFASPEYCYGGDDFKDQVKNFKHDLQLSYSNYSFAPCSVSFDEEGEKYLETGPWTNDNNGDYGKYHTCTRLGWCMHNSGAGILTNKKSGDDSWKNGIVSVFNIGWPTATIDNFLDKVTTFVEYDDNGPVSPFVEQDSSIFGFPQIRNYGTAYERLTNIYMAYIYPTDKILNYNKGQDDQPEQTIPIEDVEFTDSVSPFNFMDEHGNLLIQKNDQYSLYGGKQFINWTSTMMFYERGINEGAVSEWKKDGGVWGRNYSNGPWIDVSGGGKYLLLTSGSGSNAMTHPDQHASSDPRSTYGKIQIAALCKNKGSYGYKGTEEAQYSDAYLSFGDYFPIEEDKTEYEKQIFNGDAYLNMFNFQYLHTQESALYHPASTPTIYSVPIFSRIDLRGRFGDMYIYNNDHRRNIFFQDDPVVMQFYTQNKGAYLYNMSYSQEPVALQYYSVYYSSIYSNKFDCRITVSEIKENNEIVDKWLKFKSANFLDVDTTFGQVTNLRSFKNSLLYWQTDAFGKLSVNERQLLQAANDSQIILGTGGVLDRFDYITTKYGMAIDEQVDSQSSTALYWWDSGRRKILGYSEGNSPVVLQDVANMKNYINNTTNKRNPCITYDVKTNDVIFNLFKTSPIVYNENVRRFISEWQTSYKYSTTVLGVVYYANNGNIYTDGGTALRPYLKYVVNKLSTYNKVFDNTVFGGRLYGGDDVSAITFKFTTPLKQSGEIQLKENNVTNREYDFRFAIPRNNNSAYGDRLRGKTMQGELTINDNEDFNPTKDFSLQYIITKYRVSWT